MFNKKIEICNRALGLVNQAPITSLHDNSTEAQTCNFLYPLVKSDVLTSYPWKASLQTLVLSAVGNEIYNIKGNLAYKFLLPENCLQVILVNESSFIKQGQCIYCPMAKVTITYSANIIDEELDCSLAHLISLKLAYELSYRYAEDNIGLAGLLQDNYNKEFKILSNQDAKVGENIIPTDIEVGTYSWLTARMN
ncbi:phage tail tubular protein A [Candidatus Hepatincola sp. Av]